MNKRFALLLAGTIIAFAAALLFANLARASAPAAIAPTYLSAQDGRPSDQPEIGASRRISIPYGIASPLPLLTNRTQVAVSGHGGCPVGETVTIVISITQPSYSASATGQTVEECTGEEETYQLTATALTSATFVPGDATACGVATMYLDGEITEVEEWCRAEPALLVEYDEFLYLPLAARAAAE